MPSGIANNSLLRDYLIIKKAGHVLSSMIYAESTDP